MLTFLKYPVILLMHLKKGADNNKTSKKTNKKNSRTDNAENKSAVTCKRIDIFHRLKKFEQTIYSFAQPKVALLVYQAAAIALFLQHQTIKASNVFNFYSQKKARVLTNMSFFLKGMKMKKLICLSAHLHELAPCLRRRAIFR